MQVLLAAVLQWLRVYIFLSGELMVSNFVFRVHRGVVREMGVFTAQTKLYSSFILVVSFLLLLLLQQQYTVYIVRNSRGSSVFFSVVNYLPTQSFSSSSLGHLKASSCNFSSRAAKSFTCQSGCCRELLKVWNFAPKVQQ